MIELGFNIILYITVTNYYMTWYDVTYLSYDTVTSYDHIIIYHKKILE